jgi:hypothetical protein
MRSMLAFVSRTGLVLVLALWLGGMVALFVFIQALFQHDRATAQAAGPVLFHVFDVYQRLLAGAGVVLALVLTWRGAGWTRWLVLLLTLVAAAGAAVMAVYVMPETLRLTELGETGSARFKALHGQSMMIYTAEAAALLAGLVLLSIARSPTRIQGPE